MGATWKAVWFCRFSAMLIAVHDAGKWDAVSAVGTMKTLGGPCKCPTIGLHGSRWEPSSATERNINIRCVFSCDNIFSYTWWGWCYLQGTKRSANLNSSFHLDFRDSWSRSIIWSQFTIEAFADCDVADLKQGSVVKLERKAYCLLGVPWNGDNSSPLVFFEIPSGSK